MAHTAEALAELDGMPDTGRQQLEDLKNLLKEVLMFLHNHSEAEFTGDSIIDDMMLAKVAMTGILLTKWLHGGVNVAVRARARDN